MTYAHKILKSESPIDWREPAGRIVDRIRAFDPFPGCLGTRAPARPREAGGGLEPIKIWGARVAPGHAPAGTAPAVLADPGWSPAGGLR